MTPHTVKVLLVVEVDEREVERTCRALSASCTSIDEHEVVKLIKTMLSTGKHLYPYIKVKSIKVAEEEQRSVHQ